MAETFPAYLVSSMLYSLGPLSMGTSPISMGSPPPWHGSLLCLLLPPFCLPSVPCASVPKMHNTLFLEVSLSLEQPLLFLQGADLADLLSGSFQGLPAAAKMG